MSAFTKRLNQLILVGIEDWNYRRSRNPGEGNIKILENIKAGIKLVVDGINIDVYVTYTETECKMQLGFWEKMSTTSIFKQAVRNKVLNLIEHSTSSELLKENIKLKEKLTGRKFSFINND